MALDLLYLSEPFIYPTSLHLQTHLSDVSSDLAEQFADSTYPFNHLVR